MARPAGLPLSEPAYRDLTGALKLSMTEVAARSGMPLKTLSGLVNGSHRASIRTVRQLAEGLNCNPATLFPDLRDTPAAIVARDEDPAA